MKIAIIIPQFSLRSSNRVGKAQFAYLQRAFLFSVVLTQPSQHQLKYDPNGANRYRFSLDFSEDLLGSVNFNFSANEVSTSTVLRKKTRNVFSFEAGSTYKTRKRRNSSAVSAIQNVCCLFLWGWVQLLK